MTGAEVITKTLEWHGIKRVFGIPGAQNLELFDAFRKANFETVLTTHELCAAFMADATSRVSGQVGVAAVVPGPGLTNLLSGLAEALLDSSPLVVIVSGKNTELNYSFQLHEIDQIAVVAPVAKAVLHVEKPEEIEAKVSQAISTANSEEPGPVVVEVPLNLLIKSAPWTDPPPGTGPAEPSQDLPIIPEVVQHLLKAQKIGIYAGRGSFPASREIIELAELLQAPVATTITGRGVIPEDHPLSVGYGFGRSGTRIARKVFSKCDLILAIGCKFSEVGTGGYGLKIPGKLIHIDANPKVLKANYPSSISICSDSKIALSQILEQIMQKIDAPRENPFQDRIKKSKEKETQKIKNRPTQTEWVDPSILFQELRELLPRNAIITTDSGHHMFFALSSFPIYEPRTFITPTDYQTMGFSIPAAIAAKLACPQQQVLATVGDGGFLMTGFELLTAFRFNLNLPVLIFNDGALGLIQSLQKRAYVHTHAVELVNPNFQCFAQAVHAEYNLIKNNEEIIPQLKEALSKTGVVLIEILVRYPELTDYITGQILENIKRYSWSQKMRSLTRLINRTVFPFWAS